MINFGAKKHDDLVDAFSLLVNSVMSLKHIKRTVGVLNLNSSNYKDSLIILRDRGFDEEPKKK